MLLGRMDECAAWLTVQDAHGDWGTLIVGKEGREAKMPTFGTKAEVDARIRNRRLGMMNTGEEEYREHRTGVFKETAQSQARAIDEANKNEQN